MEPAPATEEPLAPSPATPPPSPGRSTATPRKTRSDAKLEQLSPARRERLHAWLEDENRSYAEVVHLLRAEFNLTVGKSAVSLYWRRHLLPRHHEEEAEIAATLAALPAADFATATLNQARALAWTALTRPHPQIQDAARLLNLLHRAERLTISRQRLALEQRRLALREAEVSAPKAPRPVVPSPSARPQPPEPRLPLRSLGEGEPPADPGASSNSSRSPYISGLFRPLPASRSSIERCPAQTLRDLRASSVASVSRIDLLFVPFTTFCSIPSVQTSDHTFSAPSGPSVSSVCFVGYSTQPLPTTSAARTARPPR